MTITVVDDDVSWAHILSLVIRAPGRTVHVVYTMADAMIATQHGPIDLLILDLSLPDSSPNETLDTIQFFKAAGVDRVAIVTGGHLSDDLEAKCRAAGANDLITKTCATFKECVADVIAGRAVAGGC